MTNPILTKEFLEDLYFAQKMSMGQISKQFGYKTHHPIRDLFIKYGIERRTKEDGTRLKAVLYNEEVKIDKEILENDLKNFSILQLKKKYKVSRDRIYQWMKEYGLENNYYKNIELKEILKSIGDEYSPKDLAIKYDVTITIIKKFKNTFRTELYTINEIKEKIRFYNYDLSNRGFPKQLLQDDKALYDSIIYHTRDHLVTSTKITEKIYRLLNDFSPKELVTCKHCDVILQFYNFGLGYGNSKIGICRNCLAKHNGFGVSEISQNLFWAIYNNLETKSNCYFNELNNEYKIYIEEKDKYLFGDDYIYLNKSRYNIDFLYGDKIIEFDGTYWHQDEYAIKKDIIKDKFLLEKGYKILRIPEKDYVENPEQTIQRCLTFLKQ